MGIEGRIWELVDEELSLGRELSQGLLDAIEKVSCLEMRLMEAEEYREGYWALDEVDRPRTYGTEWRGGRR
jgi:hypothetical protein